MFVIFSLNQFKKERNYFYYYKMLKPIAVLSLLLAVGYANVDLTTIFEWKEIDFAFESAEERWNAIENFEFRPENVIPFGIEVYKSRLFITLPRWREGVPASLAYINISDNMTKSPPLIPYPSWEAHDIENNTNPELVSPFRIKSDKCGRLWVLDTRIDGILDDAKIYGPTQLLVYDLHNDDLLRRHVFPKEQVKTDSLYANLVIEDDDCENTFAYAADLGSPGLVVYSWKHQESWRVQHHFFHPDPLSGNYSIGGIEFQWEDGLYGLALGKENSSEFSTLYFHPLSSTMEFSVDTGILRNKTVATSEDIYHKFKKLGPRGPNAQAGASYWDKSTNVLFYTLPNLNAVACWNTSNSVYDRKYQGIIYQNSDKLVFPSDIKVDDQNNLWVLSNRLQEFIYGELFPNSKNFRIFTINVQRAVEETVCSNKSPSISRSIEKVPSNTDLKTASSKSIKLQLNNFFVILIIFMQTIKFTNKINS